MAQNKQSAIAPVQLAAVMGAALLADVFLQPFGRRAPLLTAQHGILCAAGQMAIDVYKRQVMAYLKKL